ncbi:hypothetical protein CLOM_g21161, partial [Closterium sp. NIES-68]
LGRGSKKCSPERAVGAQRGVSGVSGVSGARAAGGGAAGEGSSEGGAAEGRRSRFRRVFCMDAPSVACDWCSDGEDMGAQSGGGFSDGEEGDEEDGDDAATVSCMGASQHNLDPHQNQHQHQLQHQHHEGDASATSPGSSHHSAAHARSRSFSARGSLESLERASVGRASSRPSTAQSGRRPSTASSASAAAAEGASASQLRRIASQQAHPPCSALEAGKVRRVATQHGGEATVVPHRHASTGHKGSAVIHIPRSLTQQHPPAPVNLRPEASQGTGKREDAPIRLPRSLTQQQPQHSHALRSAGVDLDARDFRRARSQQQPAAVVAPPQQQQQQQQGAAQKGEGGAADKLFAMLDALAKERPQDLAKLQQVVALHGLEQAERGGRRGGRGRRAGEGMGDGGVDVDDGDERWDDEADESDEARSCEGKRAGSRRSKERDGPSTTQTSARDAAGTDVDADADENGGDDIWERAQEEEEAAAARTDSHPRHHVLGREFSDVAASFVIIKREVLGQGELGTVRRCVEVASGEVYACKTVEKRGIVTREDARDVRRMVACLEAVRGHPHVLALKAVFEDAENIHVVTGLCAGGELFDLIRCNGRLSEGVCASVCRGVVAALLHCHRQGIMHRDVKPENILLLHPRSHSPVKLSDFGVATAFKKGVPLHDVMGTREYMAPEVIKGAYGPEADVWSAGAVLYIMLCGAPPFWSSANHSVTDAILRKPVTLRTSRWRGVSEEAKDLVVRMLEKDPRRRITCNQVLDHPWILKWRRSDMDGKTH